MKYTDEDLERAEQFLLLTAANRETIAQLIADVRREVRAATIRECAEVNVFKNGAIKSELTAAERRLLAEWKP